MSKRVIKFSKQGATEEIWKNIPRFNGLYQVSSEGRIRKIEKSGYRYMTLFQDKDGYEYVNTSYNGVSKKYRAHRLVCEAFIGEPVCDTLQVNHKNGIRNDNRYTNLEWVTNEENMQHSYDIGIRESQKGEMHGGAKLTKEQVLEARRRHDYGETAMQIAKDFNVTKGCINAVVSGKSWAHLPFEKKNRRNRRVINTESGVIYDSVAAAYLSLNPDFTLSLFHLMLKGEKVKNRTNFKYYHES